MKTFLDSNVLMLAWKGRETDADAALAVIEDTSRQLLTSEMMKQELRRARLGESLLRRDEFLKFWQVADGRKARIAAHGLSQIAGSWIFGTPLGA